MNTNKFNAIKIYENYFTKNFSPFWILLYQSFTVSIFLFKNRGSKNSKDQIKRAI